MPVAVQAEDEALRVRARRPDGERRWYRTSQGQTLAVIPPPGEVRMGEGDERHRRRIDRAFAVATKEVTVEQFKRFRPRHPFNNWYAPTADCPMIAVRPAASAGSAR